MRKEKRPEFPCTKCERRTGDCPSADCEDLAAYKISTIMYFAKREKSMQIAQQFYYDLRALKLRNIDKKYKLERRRANRRRH